MKTIMSVGVAVISSFLLICNFCNFVSCKSELPCDEGCTRDNQHSKCICPATGQPEKPVPITNQRTKRSNDCGQHTTLCKSVGDPHFTSFNGNYFHIYKEGVYSLLKLDSRSLWIQVKHVSCAYGEISCTCGVMVREGNSIIGITRCNRASPMLTEYRLDNDTPRGSIETISGGWKITLVSGIMIDVIKWPWSWWGSGQYMHLYVTGLKSELAKYKGLCSVSDSPNSKCQTTNCGRYRVEDRESFFRITQSNLPSCSQSRISPQCGCRGTYPHCTYWGELLESYDIRSVCLRNPNVQKNVNKRENEVPSEEDFIDLDGQKRSEVVNRGINQDDRFFDDVRSPDLRSVLSVEDGRSRCNDALRLSPTYELCSARVDTSEIVEDCALDVDLMDNYEPVNSVPTEFETACIDNIRLALEDDKASPTLLQELKDLLARVEKLVCPSQCSQNGKCVGSKCQCNEGFMGTDCSLRIGQVPVITKIIMPVCDIRKHPCTRIHVEASVLTNPENVVCKMRSVNDIDGVPAVQTSTPVVAGGMVRCNLTQMPVSVKESNNGKSTTSFLVQVSISNDGQTYSKELPFTVLDGNCMECPASQNTPCQLKENTCSIGGRCYKARESCTQDAAKVCNPEKCTTKWTSEISTNCDDGFENCT